MALIGLWFGRLAGLVARIPLWVWPLAALIWWGAAGRLALDRERKDRATEHQAQAAVLAKAKLDTATTEATWKGKFDAQQKHHAAEVDGIRADLGAALVRVRERPARRVLVPGAPAAACSGGTGAELSGPDAEFLVREAARGDIARAAYEDCRAGLEALSKR